MGLRFILFSYVIFTINKTALFNKDNNINRMKLIKSTFQTFSKEAGFSFSLVKKLTFKN